MSNVKVELLNNGFKVTKLEEPPSQEEVLGQIIVEKDLEIQQLKEMNTILGQQIVSLDLRLKEGGL